MINLVFATNNSHKLKEIKNITHGFVNILSLKDIGCSDEIPETGNSLEENAFQKSNYIYSMFGLNCFADDTGLEVDTLNGRPGVYSARYAGNNCSFDDNMNKLLIEMENHANRLARFRTVISLIMNGRKHSFEGCVSGVIIKERKGIEGFGYDPVFLPAGYNQTFAEMPLELKNKISHRSIAIKKMVDYLRSLKQ